MSLAPGRWGAAVALGAVSSAAPATAGQLEDPHLLVQGICAGCDRVHAGADASFVLVRGSTLTEILAERPSERIVVRSGLRQP